MWRKKKMNNNKCYKQVFNQIQWFALCSHLKCAILPQKTAPARTLENKSFFRNKKKKKRSKFLFHSVAHFDTYNFNSYFIFLFVCSFLNDRFTATGLIRWSRRIFEEILCLDLGQTKSAALKSHFLFDRSHFLFVLMILV